VALLSAQKHPDSFWADGGGVNPMGFMNKSGDWHDFIARPGMTDEKQYGYSVFEGYVLYGWPVNMLCRSLHHLPQKLLQNIQ
jgi:hypothetical protein